MPAGRLRKLIALWRHVWVQWSFAIGRRLRLRLSAVFKAPAPRRAPILVKQAIQS